MTRFTQTVQFNEGILHIKPRPLGHQSDDEIKLSLAQLREEVDELELAHNNGNLVECVDAVIDGLYFGYGILYKMGLDEKAVNEIFTIVHKANMEKMIGRKENRPGFTSADATKPYAWVAPEQKIKMALARLVLGSGQ
jgi:predicted HAD superfamily Cof-like phosphohydrolase